MMKLLTYFFIIACTVTVSAQDWEHSYTEALEYAKEEGKPLVLVFAGSDWCAPCIKLDREIWQSDDFKKYASENYILYKADFPRKKSNKLSEKMSLVNAKLADQFNPNGHFPLVVVLNGEQQVLGALGYEKTSPEAYIQRLNALFK